MTMASTQASEALSRVEDDHYSDFLENVQAHFDEQVRTSPQLFHTDASGLWETYLDNSPALSRQSRNCRCCRAFIERFGDLVTIAEDGSIQSAVWPKNAPPACKDAARALRRAVERANVTGAFRGGESTWGTPVTGPWTHLALTAPPQVCWTSRIKSPDAWMAEKREEFRMLERSLVEYPLTYVRTAFGLLTNGTLPQSEKCEGVAKWLLKLHEALENTRPGRVSNNIMWLAVAKAPPGYCHVRSGMIGTLLDDIVAGLPFDDIKRKWTGKMDPLQYMRPQAAPSAGNIAQAEKIVATLRSAGALERRFAKLSDVQSLWVPERPSGVRVAAAPQRSGVFGHVAPRAATPKAPYDAPPVVMTWSKFRAVVLPTAEEIEFLVPSGKQQYTAMVTAKNAGAPNLLQWDNPVSHYVYVDGSPASRWGLVSGRHHRVTAVVLRPWMWDETKTALSHQGAGVLFALEGAKDLNYLVGGGMFPQNMRSEYHAVRSTMEAHFKSATIAGKHEAEVCGISLVKGPSMWNLVFRVTSRGVRTSYTLDRWD